MPDSREATNFPAHRVVTQSTRCPWDTSWAYSSPVSRYAYGYIGMIVRLRGPANTTAIFLCHVSLNLTWKDDDGRNKCCFARVLEYSANFPDRNPASGQLVSPRDLAQWYISTANTQTHTGSKLQFWRFADVRGRPFTFLYFMRYFYFPL